MRRKGSKNDTRAIGERIIARLTEAFTPRHMVLGFDGFIDELCRALDRREGADDLSCFEGIAAFAKRIESAAGLSTAIELRHRVSQAGGNAPNMGRALLKFGNELSLIACIGREGILPEFQELAASCRNAVSLEDPGRTLALEFRDGKIMLNRPGGLEMISWELVLRHVPAESLSRLLESASLAGLLDWSINPSQSEIFKEILRIIAGLEVRPAVFFDLSDLLRRSDRDIREIFGIIGESGAVTPTVLGLNESESQSMVRALSVAHTDITARAAAIRERAGIACVVIHSREGASVADARGSCWVDGPYCASPIVSTGGGDNFNAGFCNAWLLGMAPEECALMAACTSGYFVAHGASPGREDLISFIREYCRQ